MQFVDKKCNKHTDRNLFVNKWKKNLAQNAFDQYRYIPTFSVRW